MTRRHIAAHPFSWNPRMSTLQQLLDQQAAIARQIEVLKTQSKGQAVAQVKALMEEYGLTIADIGGGPARKASGPASGKKVAAKYRSPEGGQTWTGRGLKPKWLTEALAKGKALSDFTI